MVTRRDYSAELVAAAKSVIIELTHLLAEYREEIVLVGGWVPTLLIEAPQEAHVGSVDVDLALNHTGLDEEGYQSIQRLLLNKGYQQGNRTFTFLRTVQADSGQTVVEVDLVAGEYGGTGRKHRHQRVQGLLARKARGCDLAFEQLSEVQVEGELPGGGRDEVTIRVASIVPFLVMKSFALASRLKEKDAWDIHFCLVNYPGGVDSVIEEFKPHMDQATVQEALEKLMGAFESPNHYGPKFVADFEEMSNPEERELTQRDAYERARHLLEGLGFGQKEEAESADE